MTIFGWDASHYDLVPTGARVVADGIEFMTHKVGGDAPDAELGAWWTSMKPYRGRVLLLGAYWVLRPDRARAPAAAQAFLARLDSQCPGWRDGPFVLQLDCELWNSDQATLPNRTYIQTFGSTLVDAMPKLRPIVYAPQWAYGSSLTGLGFPLWASSFVSGRGSYRSLYPGDSSPRWGPYSGQVPAILQYTSSATIAGQPTSDANAYRGTLDQLTALVAPGWKDDAVTPADIQAIITAVRNTREFLSDTEVDIIATAAAAKLAPQFAALTAAVAALNGAVDITPAELEAAILAALRDLAAPAPAAAPEVPE